MKAFALILVLVTLMVGTYLSLTKKPAPVSKDAMIEDSVGSQMAAPLHPERPL